LIFSDDKKFKFVEYIELSPLTKGTVELSNGRRITFSANFNKHGQGTSTALIVDEPEEWLADLEDAIPEFDEVSSGLQLTTSPRVKDKDKKDKEKEESGKGKEIKDRKIGEKDGEKPGLASKDSKRILKK